MEFTLNHPFIFEFVDRTRSSRPPREALAPPSDPAAIVQAFLHSPYGADQPAARRHLLPLLAFWGD